MLSLNGAGVVTISPPFLAALLAPERPLCFGDGRIGAAQHLAGVADPPPFANQAPVAEEVGLDVEVIVRWTPLFGQRWGGVKRESRRVPVRRSAAERVERLGRLPSPFQ